GEGSFYLNVEDGDNEEYEVKEVRRPMRRENAKKKRETSSSSSSSVNEEALASLMVNEYAMINESYNVKKTQNQEVCLEIKKRELKLKLQELAI
nr:hypothetical protein [Tanacetum cinerariifolium]